MAYTVHNFKTKKALREALKRGERIEVFQPGLTRDITGAEPTKNGTIFLEGPHYPAPHTWYAQGKMKAGLLVSIK